MGGMKASFVPILALLCWLLPAGSAYALKSDQSQPLLVKADSMRYDDVKQTDVYTGDVVMTKGSIAIHADRVEIHQTPDGYAVATAFGNAGQLASYDEELDAAPGAPSQSVQGRAMQLHYDGKTDVVTLTGRAWLERRRDGRPSDRAEGEVITYDDLSDHFTVTGGRGGTSSTNPSGRVSVMLAPHGAAPQASRPGTALRPSPSLDGTR